MEMYRLYVFCFLAAISLNTPKQKKFGNPFLLNLQQKLLFQFLTTILFSLSFLASTSASNISILVIIKLLVTVKLALSKYNRDIKPPAAAAAAAPYTVHWLT